VVQDEVEKEVVALVDAGIDTILTKEVRSVVERQADDGVHLLVEEILVVLPDRVRSQVEGELPEIERTLHHLVRETLDTLWTGSLRADLEQRVEGIARALLHGELAGVQDEMDGALHRVRDEVLQILLTHWSRLQQLLVPVLASAMRTALTAGVEEGLQTLASTPADRVEERVTPVRHQLAHRGGALRERLAEATEEIQEQLGRGIGEAVRDGIREHRQLGQAPRRLPPSGPTRRPPPGARSS
jgi:hypothetical protein